MPVKVRLEYISCQTNIIWVSVFYFLFQAAAADLGTTAFTDRTFSSSDYGMSSYGGGGFMAGQESSQPSSAKKAR